MTLATTWPERGFSTLCRVKTKQRNRLLDVTLNALINVSINGPDRTITRKSSIEGLYVCAGGLTFCKLTKTPLIYSISYSNLGSWSFVWGAKPTKPPRRRDWVQSSLMMRARLRLLMRFVIEMDKNKELTESDRANTKDPRICRWWVKYDAFTDEQRLFNEVEIKNVCYNICKYSCTTCVLWLPIQ